MLWVASEKGICRDGLSQMRPGLTFFSTRKFKIFLKKLELFSKRNRMSKNGLHF